MTLNLINENSTGEYTFPLVIERKQRAEVVTLV